MFGDRTLPQTEGGFPGPADSTNIPCVDSSQVNAIRRKNAPGCFQDDPLSLERFQKTKKYLMGVILLFQSDGYAPPLPVHGL